MKPEDIKSLNSTTQRTLRLNFLSHFRNLCMEGKERFEEHFEMPFDKHWFTLPTTEYNPALAFASMGVCLTGYENFPSNNYKYILHTMSELGLEDIDISAYYHRNSEDHTEIDDNVNLVAYTFGHMSLSDVGSSRQLVFMFIRGTSVSTEWNSNADVADSVRNNDYNVRYHEGFKRSADEAVQGLADYLKAHNLDPEDCVLWILGHSRGATIVNDAAALIEDGDPEINLPALFTRDTMYAYTFASSLTTTRDDAKSEKFTNIFNVLSPEDYIPRIPMVEWSYKRFGQDIYLPSICTNFVDYSKYRDAFLKQFKSWTHIDFPAYHGFEYTNGFEHIMCNISGSLHDMYTHKRFTHGGTITFRRYFRIFMELAGHVDFKQDIESLAEYGIGPFEHFLGFFLKNQIDPHGITAHAAPGAHQEEGYLAKLMLIYQMNIDITQPALLKECDTHRLGVYGPAEIIVKDPNGTIVAHIDEGKINADVFNAPGFISVFADDLTGGQFVWIPDSGQYEIDIRVKKSGNFDFTWAKQEPLGLVLEQDAYSDVKLDRDQTITWKQICAETADSHSEPGSNVSVETVLSGPLGETGLDEQGNAHYDTLTTRWATAGDHVSVTAFHDKHYGFKGWFAEGADPAHDAPLSTDKHYVFPIKKNMRIIAHFEKRF